MKTATPSSQSRFRIGSKPPDEMALEGALQQSKAKLETRQAARHQTPGSKPAKASKFNGRKSATVAPSVEDITLSYNEKQGGVELRFPSPKVRKMDEYQDIATFLKDKGWGFAKMRDGKTVYDPRWYKKLDESKSALKEGIAVLQVYGGVSELPDTLNVDETTVAQ